MLVLGCGDRCVMDKKVESGWHVGDTGRTNSRETSLRQP